MDEFLAGADAKEENARELFEKYLESGDLLQAIQATVGFSIATIVRTLVYTGDYVIMARSAAMEFCEEDAQTMLSFSQNGDATLLTDITLAPESTQFCTKPVSAFLAVEYKNSTDMRMSDFKIVVEKIGGVQIDKLTENPDLIDPSWFVKEEE